MDEADRLAWLKVTLEAERAWLHHYRLTQQKIEEQITTYLYRCQAIERQILTSEMKEQSK